MRASPSGKASAFQADIRGSESRRPLKVPQVGVVAQKGELNTIFTGVQFFYPQSRALALFAYAEGTIAAMDSKNSPTV